MVRINLLHVFFCEKCGFTNALTAQVEVLLKDTVGRTARKAREVGHEQQNELQNKQQHKEQNAPRCQKAEAPQATVQDGPAPAPDPEFTVPPFNLFGNSSDSPNLEFEAGGNTNSPETLSGVPFKMTDMRYEPREENAGVTSNELLGLGLFEALPPTQMIEELSVSRVSGESLASELSC